MSESVTETTDAGWRGIYVLGAVAAVLALAGTLLDIVLASIPGWQASTVPTSVEQWFAQFQANPLLGLRNLDLLNIVVALVGLPMYVALYGVHRKTRTGLASLALVLVAIGTAVFVASNVALPMFELSRQYGLASTESQRVTIQAAGVAMLARGSHGSMGVFAGFLLPTLGTSLLLVYIAGATFSPATSGALMAVAGLGGVLMMMWNVRVARVLFRMSGSG